MKILNAYFCFGLVFCSLLACSQEEQSDAYGNFEATTVTVSAEGQGQLLYFDVEEGAIVKAQHPIGLIDTTQLYLEKLRLIAQMEVLPAKTREAAPEIAILLERKQNLIRERNRTQALLKQKAATQKQLDDYNGEIDVVARQIASTQQEIDINNRGILAEDKPLQAQIQALDNQMKDHLVINPIQGTVLTKLAEPSEFVTPGTSLYRVANLESLRLRAYTSADLLAKVALNDQVTVLIDDGKTNYKQLEGKVIWIASEAEFTPKTIETKKDRVNLVYALDVLVKNDGTLKIGMPGEVIFKPLSSENK